MPPARSPTYEPPRLMDEELLEMARHHAYGSLGLTLIPTWPS
jgi:hypothetical protein